MPGSSFSNAANLLHPVYSTFQALYSTFQALYSSFQALYFVLQPFIACRRRKRHKQAELPFPFAHSLFDRLKAFLQSKHPLLLLISPAGRAGCATRATASA